MFHLLFDTYDIFHWSESNCKSGVITKKGIAKIGRRISGKEKKNKMTVTIGVHSSADFFLISFISNY